MRDILAERGVADERTILEDQAESTKANFRNTAQLIDPSAPVVLISSNYHMDRAVQTAKYDLLNSALPLGPFTTYTCRGRNQKNPHGEYRPKL